MAAIKTTAAFGWTTWPPGLAHPWPRCAHLCGLHDSRQLERKRRYHRSHRCVLPFGHGGACEFIGPCGRGHLDLIPSC